MIANQLLRVQGRHLSTSDLTQVQLLIDEHPHWSRHRVAAELCQRWRWETPRGQPKTFAARSLLLTLAQRHGLRLPAVRTALRREPWGLRRVPARAVDAPPPTLATGLASLQPLRWQVGRYGSPERERALAYLRQYHYLGCNRPVGTHLVYLVQDGRGRDLAVHLVGAAAWQCAARDQYIGWSAAARAGGLHRIGNHSRFLILPWVRVPNLASQVLGGLTGRIAADWQWAHGWRLELLETFVERGRFTGVAYRAAQWQAVGQTRGRTRQEKAHRAGAPRKDVWVYALSQHFRQALGGGGGPGGAR
jgi:hypothetical protein